jgi:hypothetical protein
MPLQMAADRFAYEADPFELDARKFVRRLLVQLQRNRLDDQGPGSFRWRGRSTVRLGWQLST